MRGGPYSPTSVGRCSSTARPTCDALGAAPAGMLPAILPPAGRRPGARPGPVAGPLHGRGGPDGGDGIPIDTTCSSGLRAGWDRHQGGARSPRSTRGTGSTRARASGRTGSPPTSRARASPGRGCASGALGLNDDTFRDQGQGVPPAPAAAGAAPRAGRAAAERPRGRVRRAQPLPAVGVPQQDGPQPAEQQPVPFGPATWIRGLIRPRAGDGARLRRLRLARRWASRPRSRATRPCSGRTARATSTSRSPSRPGWPRPTRRRRATRRDPRPLQGGGAGHALRHGRGYAGAAHRPPAGRGARAAPAAPGDLPHVLALVRRGHGRPGHLDRPDRDGVRLAAPRRGRVQPALPDELPDAGERGGDAAAGLLPGDRARRPGLRPGARRAPDRGARWARSTIGWPRCRRACARRAGSCSAACSSWAATPRWCAGRTGTATSGGELMWATVSRLIEEHDARSAAVQGVA